jgi:iron complex outermembrane recepter protein
VPPPASGEAVVELSPFVISAQTETGWVATETLAGTRLRTNIKDVPNQIETLTKEFMADLGLRNADQSLIYTANVENMSHDYVNTDNAVDFRNPTTPARVRGVSTSTISRNYFTANNPTDNYNIERVTVASGPNAILFGLGSPAGIIDATPARAMMRNAYGFELQFDSEESKRGTFDANTVILRDKLALRLMGLSKREYTHRKPNLDRDERVYGTITFKPFKATSITLQGERSDRRWNRAGRYTPNDSVSLWHYANEIPGSGYTVPKPVFSNTSANIATVGSNLIFTRAGTSPITIIGGDGVMRSWRDSVVVKNPRQLPGRNVIDTTFNFTIMDPAVFPFDINDRSAQVSLLTDYTKTVLVEQKLARNLFLEVAYNDEKTHGGSRNVGNGVPQVDANQFLPGTTIPNPNVGRLFGEGGAGATVTMQRLKDWRATLSYEFDLAEKYSQQGSLGKWLGRHRFFGMYSQTKSDSKAHTDISRRILDDPVLPGLTLTPRTARNWAIDNSRAPNFRQYYKPGEPVGEAGPLRGDWTMTDANNRPYSLYLFDTPFTAADGKRLISTNQPASGSLNKVDAQIFAWQGFFLPDHEKENRLILTFGYRKDNAKSATFDVPSVTQDFSGLYPGVWDAKYGRFGATESGINRNIGIVARPVKWLTAFYNHSTTFDLNTGRYDPFGNEIPGANGKGRDYGIRFDVWKDKASVRINRYESSSGPVLASQDIARLRPIFLNIENRVRVLDPGAPTINVGSGTGLGYPVAGTANYNIMTDIESSGYEVELNFSPNRNLSIRVNGARTEVEEANIGGPWFAWAAQRLPVWQGVVAKNGEVDAANRPVTWATAPLSVTNPTGETLQQYYNTALIGNAFAFMQAAEGRTNNAHPMRANVIGRYRFTEGRLQGFSFGGAMRWRDAPTIGYGITTNASGNILIDLDRAYRGKKEIYFDTMLGYRGRMKMFGGFSYRLQLNVRNLLDESDPIPVTALTNGQVSRIAVIEPRFISFTFGVDF